MVPLVVMLQMIVRRGVRCRLDEGIAQPCPFSLHLKLKLKRHGRSRASASHPQLIERAVARLLASGEDMMSLARQIRKIDCGGSRMELFGSGE